MSKKTSYSGIQIEASDNTYNVASPVFRMQAARRKEATMNKEIRLRRKEDEEVKSGKKTKKQVNNERKIRARQNSKAGVSSHPAQYKTEVEQRKKAAGDVAEKIEDTNQKLQEGRKRKEENERKYNGFGYQALSFLENHLTSDDAQAAKMVNGEPTWAESSRQLLNSMGKKWSDFWDKPIYIDHSFDSMNFDGDIAVGYTGKDKTERTTLGDATERAFTNIALATGIPAAKPFTLATSLGAGYVGSYLGGNLASSTARSFGGNEDAQRLFGTVGSTVGGITAGTLGGYWGNTLDKTIPLFSPATLYRTYKVNPTGFTNIRNDIMKRPMQTWRARRNGEYPLTTSEQRKYILDRRKAIEEGIEYNRDKLEKEIKEFREYNKKYQSADEDLVNRVINDQRNYFNNTVYYDRGANVAKNFGLSDDAVAHAARPENVTYRMSKIGRIPTHESGEVVIRRRELGSNLPYTPISSLDNNLKGTAGHEFDHILKRTSRKDPLSEHSWDIPYRIPYRGLKGTPFEINLTRNENLVKEFNNSGIPRKDRGTYEVWQNSPEEFSAEYTFAKVTGIEDQIGFLSNRFGISRKEALDKMKWLDENGYKSGGKIKYFK